MSAYIVECKYLYMSMYSTYLHIHVCYENIYKYYS